MIIKRIDDALTVWRDKGLQGVPTYYLEQMQKELLGELLHRKISSKRSVIEEDATEAKP